MHVFWKRTSVFPSLSYHRQSSMVVAPRVCQARDGQGDELVALFQKFNTRRRGAVPPRFRILTDASGPFFTIVTVAEAESFAAWEGRFREAMDRPWMGEWFERMMPLVESGSREFYTIVE